jgi:hypothetical protein
MATIVHGTLRYDTNIEEGCIKFIVEPDDVDSVVMLDIVNDWIHHLEALRRDLHSKLYKECGND